MCLALALVIVVADAALPAAPKASETPASVLPKGTPGEEISQMLSTVTGVAISPLLGVAAVGAWRYMHTPDAAKASLPWFSSPMFWIPALLLVAACFAKDTLGPVVPTTLKKPFDVAELVENKVSAVVATGAFVPIIASVFKSQAAQSSIFAGTGLAAMDVSPLLNLITVPVAMAVFLTVWVVSHAINVLIIISPFATVDAALKAFRISVLGVVTASSFWGQGYMGAAVSLFVIIVCYLLAGWAFRLMVFGNVFAWDILTFAHNRHKPAEKGELMFTARAIDKLPIRTLGRVHRNEQGHLVMKHRPWLFMAAEEKILPEGKYAIGRGLLHPELLKIEGEELKVMMKLPPRSRDHEDTLAKILDLEPTRDVGLMAALQVIKSLFGFPTRTA